MTRTLHADTVTAAQAETGEIFHLFEFAFSGGTLYLTDASNDIVWSGNTYTAVDGLSHDAVQETTQFGAQSVRVTVSGVDTSVLTRILQQNYVGQSAIIRHAHIASDGTITSNPVIVFQGLMNAAFEMQETFDPDGGTAKITTRLVSPFAIISKVNGIRSNVSSHQKFFSTDTFFRHLSNITDQPVFWGNASPIYLHGSGGSGSGGSNNPDSSEFL